MKTEDIHNSNSKETRMALSLAAFLILLILLVGRLSAAPKVGSAPKENVSFTAKCNNYYALIKWEALNDSNVAYYSIERTQDSVHYENVATVKAVNGSTVHKYSVMDENPMTGISYYRISKTDTNGKTVYLHTMVYTPCENDQVINAFNEGTNVFIQVNAKAIDSCNITINDMDGNEVLSQTRKIIPGLNDFTLMPGVEKGQYMIHVTYKGNEYNKILTLDPSVN